MARTLELTLACVLTLMGGVYVLRSSRAEQARHQAELAAAVARRASLSEALLEARAALEKERRWQGDERANLTRALQQRRRRCSKMRRCHWRVGEPKAHRTLVTRVARGLRHEGRRRETKLKG